jgi:cytoskeleton protein RodZ
MASPKRKINPNSLFDQAAAGETDAEVIAMPIPEAAPTDRQSRQPALRVGEVLKRERERRGYDLQQIADYLCIRRGLLLAIENSRYEEFPADAYVIGFLRSYADLIGLDGQEAISYYRQEMAGRRRKPDLILPTPISEGRAPTAVIIGAAAFASLLIYILWYAFSTGDRTTVTTPPALPAAIDAPAATAPSPQATATPAAETLLPAAPPGVALSSSPPAQKISSPAVAPDAAAAASPPHIEIRAEQSSWVLVSNNKGQTVYDRVMKPGETYQVPDEQGLTLTTGNGAGIVLTLDGADLPRLSSTTSHIVRNIPLEAKSLKSLPRQPAQ